MAAVIESWFRQDLQKPVQVHYLDGSLFSNNGNGNRIGVELTNGGEDYTVTGTVSGYAVLADGSTVPCTGAKSGNKASILVPPAAYLPGNIFITIFLTDGTTVTTLAAVSSTVIQARTDNQVSPGSVVTDWTNTINAAMQSVETAAANLGKIVATPYAQLTFPVPLGKYTYYNNNLYRCTTPIATSEDFTAAHWSSALNLGDEVSDLKSALGTTNNVLKMNDPTPINWFKEKDVGVKASDGADVSSSVFSATNYIDVRAFEKITYKQHIITGSSINTGIAFYDENKTFISNSGVLGIKNGAADGVQDNTVNVPAGACYVRCTIWKNQTTGAFSISGQSIMEMYKREIEWNSEALAGIVTEPFATSYSVSNGYYDVTDGSVQTNNKYVKTAKTTTFSGHVVRFAVGSDYVFRVLFWNTTTQAYIPEKATPWHAEPDGYTFYVAVNETIGIDIRRKDSGTIGDSGQAAVEASIKIWLCGDSNGIIADLGFTSLLSCNENGVYRSGAAYVSSITDMPTGYSNGAFNLFVVRPSYAAYTFAVQKLESVDGSVWRRVIEKSEGTWSVVTGYDWKMIYDSTVDSEQVKLLDIANAETIKYRVGTNKAYVRYDTGELVTGSSFTRWKASSFTDISQYDYIVYSRCIITGATTDGGIAFYSSADASDYISGESMITNGADFGYADTIISVPPTAKYMRLSIIDASNGFYVKGINKNPLKGMRLSLLGASIETFTGAVPEGNNVYYTGSNYGVKSVNEIWWKRVCNSLGMTPLVIDAWSGSAVCYNYSTDGVHTDVSRVPMCSDLRTGRLHDGDTKPDIILVIGGTNDWTYSNENTTPLGDWNGRTAVNRTAVVSGESTFMESYASMIQELHTNYPEAIIVGLSCEFTCRGTDLGCTRVNDMGLTENDYSNAIERVCKIMGIPYLNVYDVGFNYENYYPTYAEDSATITTHPNSLGHAIIAKRVIEELPRLVKQFKG